jgi:hypothetical protein
MTPRMSAARRRGLKALVVKGGTGRRSNVTDVSLGYCYWQTADWLVEKGFAYFPSGSDIVSLTDRGRDLAREVGLA